MSLTGAAFCSAAQRLRKLGSVVRGQLVHASTPPSVGTAEGPDGAPSPMNVMASVRESRHRVTPEEKVDESAMDASSTADAEAGLPAAVTTTTWRLPSPSPSPPRYRTEMESPTPPAMPAQTIMPIGMYVDQQNPCVNTSPANKVKKKVADPNKKKRRSRQQQPQRKQQQCEPLEYERTALDDVRVGDFSVSSVRALYRLRRESEEEERRKWAAMAAAASCPSVRRRQRVIKNEQPEREESKPKPKVVVAPPPPSLERELASAGRPFIVLNDICYSRLNNDLFAKLTLQRDARTALREGQTVLLRAPLAGNDGNERDCRLALSSFYMTCVQQCRDPAVPPIYFDAAAKCYELAMEPARRQPAPMGDRHFVSRTAPWQPQRPADLSGARPASCEYQRMEV